MSGCDDRCIDQRIEDSPRQAAGNALATLVQNIEEPSWHQTIWHQFFQKSIYW